MQPADHSREDPWAMYYVVRSDRRLSFAQSMALGGAGPHPGRSDRPVFAAPA